MGHGKAALGKMEPSCESRSRGDGFRWCGPYFGSTRSNVAVLGSRARCWPARFAVQFPAPLQRIVSAIPEGAVVRCRQGIRLRLHRDAAFIWPYLYGEYEEAVGAVFAKLIKPGDVVVDAGASFGWYSALFARWVGPAGRVHAFEPVPEFATLAMETLRLNGVETAVSVNVEGLGNETGEFVVYTFAGLPLGHASADSLGRADAEPHMCRLTTLDTYGRTARLHRLDFLKADVEGSERDLFLGARHLLDRHKPLIGFEINVDCLRARDLLPSEVFEPLRACGYECFWAIKEEGPYSLSRSPLFAPRITSRRSTRLLSCPHSANRQVPQSPSPWGSAPKLMPPW